MLVSIDGIDYKIIGKNPARSEKSVQYLLVMLITGPVQLIKNECKTNQNTDYSEIPHIAQKRSPSASFSYFLQSENIGKSKHNFVKDTIGDNRDFFREILAEFSNFFIQTSKGNHTTAFLHLYRILERASYSVPLLYAATQKDFLSTFSELKKFLESDIGELGFLNNFVNRAKFIDNLILNTIFQIKLRSKNNHNKSFFDLTHRLFKDFDGVDESQYTFTIKFKNIQNLIIILRNRIFHAATGDWKKNAKMQELIDTDEYFSCLNQIFANFLSVIIIRIISVKYKQI